MGWLLRLGINRGLIGGNRFFAAIGVAAGLVRVLQKVAGTSPTTTFSHKIEPGQVLVITDVPTSKTKRKEKKRAAESTS